MSRWLFVVLAIGCNGGGGGGSVALAEYPAELDRALCESRVACEHVPDLDTCLASVFAERRALYKTLAAAVEAGTAIYDPSRAADCLELVRSVECRITDDASPDDVDRECAGVFAGTIATGGACAVSQECEDHGVCVPSPGCVDACCRGVCEPASSPPPRVEIGGDCSQGQLCVDAATCGPSGTCEAIVAVATGEACGDGVRCDRFRDYCDPSTSVCTPGKAPGEACSTEVSCIDYAVCADGACVARPGPGDPCDPTVACLGDLVCAGGTCAAPSDEPACPVGGS